MDTVREHAGNRKDLAGYRNPLHQACVIQNGACSVRPCGGEEIKWDQAAHYKNWKVLLAGRQNFCKNERKHSHHYKRVEERPERSQGHIAITNLEVLKNELAYKETVIA